MATIYVRSTDGSDADDGTTWALSKASLAGSAAIDNAGDTIFVSQNHAESTAAAITHAWAGTLSSPVKIICGNDAAEPPTAVATTATVTTTGTSGITITGNLYAYGLAFNCGSGAVAASIVLGGNANEIQEYENCDFALVATSTSNRIWAGYGAGDVAQDITWKNCDVKFANASQRVGARSQFLWSGGSILAGGTAPASLMIIGVRTVDTVLLEGLDLSNGGSTMNIFDSSSTTSAVKAVIRNSKLPASWTGGLWSATPTAAGMRAVMINCDSGDTNYRLWVEDAAGSVRDETTIVRTGGASDGTTSIAWKMTSSANAEYPLVTLDSPEITVWNDTVASAVTATIEIVHDSQGAGTASAAQDDEIWMELQYLGTSGVPLGSFISDSKADVLATSADQTSSTTTWTTTGLTTPVKQKLSVTFTPQEKGYLIAKVKLAKASKVYYIDPKLTVA